MAKAGNKSGAVPAPSVAAPVAGTYPPGYFTEPVRAWKQMNFVSRMSVDTFGRLRVMASVEHERQASTGIGWGAGTVVLPGTPKKGRPGWMPVQRLLTSGSTT